MIIFSDFYASQLGLCRFLSLFVLPCPSNIKIIIGAQAWTLCMFSLVDWTDLGDVAWNTMLIPEPRLSQILIAIAQAPAEKISKPAPVH